MTYYDELTKAMTWLGEQPDMAFIGQSVLYPGNGIFNSLAGVPNEKKIEMPVAEDMQMGMSIGLAMMGKTVISIYPRMDFLMCAMNQLVNHLDKDIYPLKGKVIIRTCIGATKPLYPGVQHCGDYTLELDYLLNNIYVSRIYVASRVAYEYNVAFTDNLCSIIVEDADSYGAN